MSSYQRRTIQHRAAKSELLHVVRARTAAGDSARNLAIRLGVTPRTIVRYRARLRQHGTTWRAA